METDDDIISQITPVRDEGRTVPLRGKPRKKTFVERYGIKTFIKNFVSKKLLTFYNMHLLYLVSIAVVGSVIIYVIESCNPDEGDGLRYLDILFNCISSVCCCGLNTSDISKWRKSSLVIVIIVNEFGCLGFSTCIIVPLLRYRRAKKLVKTRRKHYFDM